MTAHINSNGYYVVMFNAGFNAFLYTQIGNSLRFDTILDNNF